MDNIVFTSDTHASHTNIIKYCNRPFANIHDMNKNLADNINKSLPNGGLVYHLGDWSFGGLNKAFDFMDMINYDIEFVLIEGNHDQNNLKDEAFRKLFMRIEKQLVVEVKGQKIVLCHYAMRVWDKSHHGRWHLYGHSHNTLPDDPNLLSIDVGVDAAAARFGEYHPFTFQEIADIMAKKKFVPVDHHQ
jgi:calcineurin-like phosphoesterase family protein